MKNLKVGDQVYAVFSHRPNMFLTVEKVGRKWITFDCGNRAEIGSDRLDGLGCSSTGRIYETHQDYIDEKSITKMRGDIRCKFQWAYKKIDPEKVKAIYKILFGEAES